MQSDRAQLRQQRRILRRRLQRLVDCRGGCAAIPTREIDAPEHEANFVYRQRLLPRRRKCLLQALAGTLALTPAELLLGYFEQCAWMLGQRGENLLVDRARVGGPAGRFVARGKREGVLNGQLHRAQGQKNVPQSGAAISLPWSL